MKKTILLLVCFAFAGYSLMAQQWQWAKGITMPYGPYLQGVQVHPAPSGNFYVVGHKWDSNYGSPAGSCLIKYNSQGNELWRKTYNDKFRILSMKIDGAENLLLAGDFRDSVYINHQLFSTQKFNDGFLLNLDSAGSVNWFKQMAGNGDESAQDVFIDKDGSIYLTGNFTDLSVFCGVTLNTTGLGASYVAKLNAGGNLLSMITANTNGSTGNNYGIRVRTDSLNNIYLLGEYDDIKIGTQSIYGGNPYGAQYLAKFDSAGKPAFLFGIIDGTESFSNFNVCDGALYFTGSGGWTSGSWSKTEKYTFNGNLEWTKIHGCYYCGFISNNIIQSSGAVYSIGYHDDPHVPVWVSTFSLTLTSTTPSGQETCMDIKSSGAAVGSDIARISANEFLIIGSMPDTISFGPTTLYKGNGNIFIAKFKDGVFVTPTEEVFAVNGKDIIFPNPSAGQFTLKLAGENNNGTICVYDALGNCILSTIINSSSKQLDLSGKAKGIYFVHIQRSQNTSVQKIVMN